MRVGLADGTTIGSTLPEGNAVAIVADPADCFACANVLPSWVEWGRRNHDRFRLFLSREPSATERTALKLLRVHEGGLVQDMPRSLDARLPVEILVVDGTVRYEHTITDGAVSTELLDYAKRVSVSALGEFYAGANTGPEGPP